MAVSTSMANHYGSLPAAYSLFLNEDWIKDEKRRHEVGIPKEIELKTKSEIALDQLRTLKERHIAPGVVLADAGYGNESDFREGLRKLELRYIVGVQKTTKVWIKGEGPLPPAQYSGKGRKPGLLRLDSEHPPLSLLEVARRFSDSDWQMVTWREGTNEDLTSRFARVRVREAHRYYNKTLPS